MLAYGKRMRNLRKKRNDGLEAKKTPRKIQSDHKKEKETKFIGQRILPFIGIGICGFLIYHTSIYDKIFGSIFVLLGIGIYFFFSRKNNHNL